MTNEELIACANKHYKVGVKFKSILSDGGAEREIDYFYNKKHIE